MKFAFTQMNEADAREILEWRYDEPYDFYNAEPTELEKDLANLIDPGNAYFALRDEDGRFIAYYCFGREARVEGGDYAENAADIGGGLRPDLTGSGFGATFMQVGMDFAALVNASEKFRVTVAAFNKRALKMCENAGFEPVETFLGPKGAEFVVLTKDG